MARFKHILLTFLLLMSYSCAAHVPVQPKTITDLRLGDERCSVHDEALIEATNSVDFERGSYRGE
ncbi:MAG: hypothetical protein KDB14_32710, partial [Planctomycetales bacterium]|nr:hypothetical protein [Planctomycetales bacterium]